MPRENLFKDPFAIPNNRISMTRHDILKSPRINSLHALVETLPITLTEQIPQHSFLPYRRTIGRLKMTKQLCCKSRIGILSRLRILFCSRHVEHQIRFNQRPIRFIIKHQFLVRMRIHKFIFKVCIELRRDPNFSLIFLGKNRLEMDIGDLLVRLSLLGTFLGKTLGSNEVGVWIGLVPLGEKDVVLEIGGCNVGDAVSERLEFACYRGGEGNGREDGELSRCETDYWNDRLAFVCGERAEKRDIPIVARPPNLIMPNRKKGTESVVIFGVKSRITMTFSGSEGTSLSDMVRMWL